jgi:hypothetical protein
MVSYSLFAPNSEFTKLALDPSFDSSVSRRLVETALKFRRISSLCSVRCGKKSGLHRVRKGNWCGAKLASDFDVAKT